MLFGKGSISSI